MNPDTLYTVAKQNSPTGAQLSELDELIAKYPWFSVAHLLKAKGMMETKDPDYPEQLQRASVHVNNRQVLFNFLHDHTAFVEANDTRSEQIAADIEEIAEHTKHTEDVEVLQPSANDQAQEESTTESEEKSLPQENPENSDIREHDLAAEAEVHDLESELESQPSANAEPEEASEEQKKEIEPADQSSEEATVDPELEKDILTFAVSRIIEKEVQEEIPEEDNSELIPTSISNEDEAELSPFARRLLKGAAKVGYGAPMEVAQQEKTVEDKKELNQNLSSGELVDAFIRTSPRITPSRVSDYSPSDSAKHSLIEDDSFVTETMAKIYAQQGKIEKARKAYKLLSLKYPEKSIYFAHQLKKLGKNK